MSQLKAKFAPTLVPYAIVGQPNGVATLDAQGKLLSIQLPSGLAGGVKFKGAFDASSGNYPASPANGDLYMVTVAGTVSGVVYTVGDFFFWSSDDSTWHKIETSRTTDELPEGTTSLYFTISRAQSAAVVNSLAGGETVKAPSVAAVAAALATKATAITRTKERFVLSAAQITAKAVVFSNLALPNSVHAGVQGLGMIEENAAGDYTLSVDGGTGFTKMTFVNDLTTLLSAGDVVYVEYAY